MMEQESVLLVVALSALGILAALNLVQFLYSRQRERTWDTTLRRIRKDMQAVCIGAANMGNHVNTLELKLHHLVERQEKFNRDDLSHHSYDHAIKMARHGAEVKDLVESCGLAQGEAELLLRVHGSRRDEAVRA